MSFLLFVVVNADKQQIFCIWNYPHWVFLFLAGTPWWSSRYCFLRFDNELKKRFTEALQEDGGLVGEGFLEVVLQTVENLGYQLPFLIGTESGLLQEVTEHYIALPKGYYTAFAFKKRSRVLRPTWASSRLRTVACASLSIMPLIKARNDGVVINSFIFFVKICWFCVPLMEHKMNAKLLLFS